MMKSITTLSLALCVVFTLSSTNAEAVSLLATDGSIRMNTTTPAPFDDVYVNLAGSNFSLRNNFLQDSWHFTGTPNPTFHHPAPGTLVDFSGTVALQSPSDRLVFQGTEYRALGTLTVATAPVPASATVTVPFTLSGTIEGQRLGVVGPPETAVRATLAGQGLLSAQFFNFDGGPFFLRSVVYDILPAAVIPEPTSVLLLGSGLAGLGLFRRGRGAVPARRRSPQRLTV